MVGTHLEAGGPQWPSPYAGLGARFPDARQQPLEQHVLHRRVAHHHQRRQHALPEALHPKGQILPLAHTSHTGCRSYCAHARLECMARQWCTLTVMPSCLKISFATANGPTRLSGASSDASGSPRLCLLDCIRVATTLHETAVAILDASRTPFPSAGVMGRQSSTNVDGAWCDGPCMWLVYSAPCQHACLHTVDCMHESAEEADCQLVARDDRTVASANAKPHQMGLVNSTLPQPAAAATARLAPMPSSSCRRLPAPALVPASRCFRFTAASRKSEYLRSRSLLNSPVVYSQRVWHCCCLLSPKVQKEGRKELQ